MTEGEMMNGQKKKDWSYYGVTNEGKQSDAI